MGMGFAPTWLRQVSPLLHKTALTTDTYIHTYTQIHTYTYTHIHTHLHTYFMDSKCNQQVHSALLVVRKCSGVDLS